MSIKSEIIEQTVTVEQDTELMKSATTQDSMQSCVVFHDLVVRNVQACLRLFFMEDERYEH